MATRRRQDEDGGSGARTKRWGTGRTGVGEKTASCNSLPIVQPRYSYVLAVNFNAVYTPSHILRAVNCPSGRITFVSDLSISFYPLLLPGRRPRSPRCLPLACHGFSPPKKTKGNTGTCAIEITEFTKSVEIPFTGPASFCSLNYSTSVAAAV